MSPIAVFFNNLSRRILVLLVLTGGVIFIVLSDPPHTICNTQIKNFKEIQKGFLYLLKKPRNLKPDTLYTILNTSCKDSNSPGGCYEYFKQLQKMLRDSETISISHTGEGTDCREDLASVTEFKKAIWSSLELMVRMAWGENPPDSYIDKKGWFGISDLKTFCQLKRRAGEVYGQEKWESFREKFFKKLPKVQTLKRDESWARMVLSINCNNYL